MILIYRSVSPLRTMDSKLPSSQLFGVTTYDHQSKEQVLTTKLFRANDYAKQTITIAQVVCSNTNRGALRLRNQNPAIFEKATAGRSG